MSNNYQVFNNRNAKSIDFSIFSVSSDVVSISRNVKLLFDEAVKDHSTKIVVEQMSVATKILQVIENDDVLKNSIVSVLNSDERQLFEKTLKQMIDNPVVNILLAAMEDWVL
jgi:hypothetical protein